MPVDLTGLSERSPCQRQIRRTTFNRYGQAYSILLTLHRDGEVRHLPD